MSSKKMSLSFKYAVKSMSVSAAVKQINRQCCSLKKKRCGGPFFGGRRRFAAFFVSYSMCEENVVVVVVSYSMFFSAGNKTRCASIFPSF
jgi:hypothetical protein